MGVLQSATDAARISCAAYCSCIRAACDRNTMGTARTIAKNAAYTITTLYGSRVLAVFDDHIAAICVRKPCDTTHIFLCTGNTACGDHILHHGAARQFAEQADISRGSGDIQRHGVAVAVKGAGKFVSIGLRDGDIRRQLIIAAGLHRRKRLRGADILHRACRRQHRRRPAAAGHLGRRRFRSGPLLLLRLLIPGRDGVLRVRQVGLLLLLLLRGQRVGQHGGGQQADDHHDGQQPAYDSLPHISFSFM